MGVFCVGVGLGRSQTGAFDRIEVDRRRLWGVVTMVMVLLVLAVMVVSVVVVGASL